MFLQGYEGCSIPSRFTFIFLLVLSLSAFIGCVSSEESFEDETMAAFDEPKTPAVAIPPAQPTPAPADLLVEELKRENADLKQENASLKQKVTKLEQDVRTLNTRVSETEAQVVAEKDRADKAETAARSLAQQAPPPAAVPTPGLPGPPTSTTLGSYQNALSSFRRYQYDEAIRQFQGLLNVGISRDLVDNCVYWIGESNFGRKQYREAISYFEKVFEYVESGKKGDATFMIARSYDMLGDRSNARAMYDKFVREFPSNRNAGRANSRLARL